ncbi:hypothetical protein [Corynebacterium sp.]|uniref:hypothetical protein n=1 Tax=Corynebacterium sp. TaxID=1720 RepID=UPI0027B8F2EF|nr:hypothetical protein [Corynebacterium sp.]
MIKPRQTAPRRPSRPSRKAVVAAVTALAVSAKGVGFGVDYVSAQVAPAQPYFSTVTAKEVTLRGNVGATIATTPTGDGEVRVLELTGDRLDVRDLAITLPGNAGDGMLTTGGALTTVEGNVRVVATSLTATPSIEGARTVPVTVDLTGDINHVLDQLGIPPAPDAALPDVLMDHLSLTNVTLELANLTADSFEAPVISVGVD